MRIMFFALALGASAIGITACGGGSNGTGTGAYVVPTAGPTAAATATPSSGATNPPAGSTTLATATLAGAPGFTAPSGRTVYVLSDDTTTSLACTQSSGCLGEWPIVAPPSGVALTTGFTTFVRSDNGQTQLAFNGHPIYTFAGDSANGQTNGNGLQSFGGTWSIAHP